MKPTSKQPEQLSELLDKLEENLRKIEGKNLSGSSKVKNQEKNQQAVSGSSSSVSAPTTPRLTSGKKSTEKTELTFDGSKVNGNPHTTPITRAKLERKNAIKEKVIQRQIKSSDDEKSNSSNTPRSVRFTDSNTTPPLSHRSAAPTPASTPMPTPAATPRKEVVAKDVSSSDSSGSVNPKSPRTTQFHKTVSRGVSKAALAIGKFGEKFASQVSSISTITLATPQSSGRNSPELHSSSRIAGKSNRFPEITPSVKNQAARALVKLESNPDFINAGDTRKTFMLNSELINVLSNNAIEINTPRLKFLKEEALERSKNYEINAEIDIQTEPYATAVNQTFKYIKSVWGVDKGDRGEEYTKMTVEEKAEVNLCFSSLFYRDSISSSHKYKIEQTDGSYKEVTKAELADFLNQDDPESIGVRKTGEVRSRIKNDEGNFENVLTHSLRSKYISLFTGQNLSNMFGNFVTAYEESIPSKIKLYDGTQISIRPKMYTTWSYSKTADGGIKVKFLMEMTSGNYKKSTVKVDNKKGIEIEDGAIATIETELYFSADRDLRIGDLKVHATGWNLPKDM